MTAAIAQSQMSANTVRAIAELMDQPSSTFQLADLSTWADEVKRLPQYRFTSSLHYVNPHDSEPSTCSFSMQRDCPEPRARLMSTSPQFGKCVVGAIQNYTYRLDVSQSHMTKQARQEAIKFLVHYIGDIHQPLHASGRQTGGNGFLVRFFGAQSNLHSVWDSGLLNRRMNQKDLTVERPTKSNYDVLLAELVSRIKYDWQD